MVRQSERDIHRPTLDQLPDFGVSFVRSVELREHFEQEDSQTVKSTLFNSCGVVAFGGKVDSIVRHQMVVF